MMVEAFCKVSTISSESEARLVSTNVKEVCFCIANINGVGFLDYRGDSLNVDKLSRPLDVSLFSFTSYTQANVVDRRFDYSL